LGFFFRGKGCVFILTKNGLGCILGDIFSNSSGHPEKDSFQALFSLQSRKIV
jgi:hypothetical protein